MPYIVNKSNGQELVTIGDRTINDSASSLTLIGKNYAGYGEFLNENYVKLLENFANSNSPNSPIDGQLWWNTSTSKLSVRASNAWKNIANLTASATAPTNPVAGDLWWDSAAGQLKAYSGTSYVIIGPVEELPGAILDNLNNFFVNSGSPNNTGTENNFIGLSAGASNTSGTRNNFFGSYAGNLNTTGSNNLFLGRSAGNAVVTGSNNTIIGTVAGSSSLTNTLIIASGSTERIRVDNDGLYVNGVAITSANSSIVSTSASQIITNKTISADNNTINGIAVSSFVLTDSTGKIDGSAAQKAIPAGVVVGTTDTQTLTNKTINAANNTINGVAASSFVMSDANGRISSSAAQKTIPAGGVVGTTDSQVLTNKSISGSQNTLTNISLTSSVTGTLPIQNGGTGGTSRSTALNSLLPAQASNAGKVLMTDGSEANWQTIVLSGGTVTSVGISPGSTGLTISNSPVVTSGNIVLGGTLAIAHGGTGATTATQAINNLLPSQTNNNGKILSTNGTNVSWIFPNPGTVTSIEVSGGTTGLIATGGPVTSNGTITLSGTLKVENGGTGTTSLTGVVIGNGTTAFTAKTNPTGAFVGTTDTQTLENKTLTNPIINGATISGTFNGDAVFSGDVTAFSDLRLKTNLTQISGALEKVKKLTGYTFTRTDTGRVQTGLIAQDVQSVLPEAVTDSEEYLSLAYGNMMGLIVEAIKEIEKRIGDLESKL